MKKIILTLILCLSFSQFAIAGNKGIFEKGYMHPEKKKVAVTMETEDFLVWSDDADIFALTITSDYNIYFTLDDVNGKQVQITLSEIYRLLRSIDPKLSDRAYQKIKEIPKGKCPVCNSEKRLTYSVPGVFYNNEITWKEKENFIKIDNITFYICADCGNVYAVEKGD